MFGSALIVFREVLEASLIIGIACAATRAVPRRALWVAGGIAAGVGGACLVAAFAEVIANALSGMGQEVFNAAILLAAVAMLGWHNVWMSRHGREMAQQMSALGHSVESGARPLYALGLVIALAVLREGSEVVLFLYGIAASGSGAASLVGGGALGLAAGATLGLALYFGLLRIPQRHLFAVTSWMILLLAAGMASQAARFLIQADFLPALGAGLWDSSHLVPQNSLLGEILKTLVGYDAHPAGMQLLFYVTTLTTIGVAMKLFGRPAPVARAAVTAALTGILIAGVLPDRAYAGAADKVYRPVVVPGETEIELRGGYSKIDEAREMSHVLDLGYGVSKRWFTEVVFKIEKATEAGATAHAQAVEWENVLQFTDPGRYFLDTGWFTEVSASMESGAGWSIETGPMLEKQFGRLVNTLDLLGEQVFIPGGEDEKEVSYRLQSQYLSGTPVEIGLQAFGAKAEGKGAGHVAGPAVFSQFRIGQRNKVRMDAAALKGLTAESEDWRLRWQLEFEFY